MWRFHTIYLFQHQESKESEVRKIDALIKEQELQKELATKRHEIDLLDLAVVNKRMLAEAEKKALRSLIGNVAHDLKTPRKAKHLIYYRPCC